MKRTVGIILAALGVLCILGAVGFNYYNEWESDRAGERSAEILAKLLDSEAFSESADSDGSSNINEASRTEQHGAGEAEVNEDNNVNIARTAEIDGSLLCGYVEIASIGLKLPVMAEYSESNMKIAPCKYTEAETPEGKIVIAGHNYTRHFGRLGRVSPGDSVVFTNTEGKSYNFTVTEICEIAANDFSSLQEGDWELALFTCNMSGAKRILVRCSLDG